MPNGEERRVYTLKMWQKILRVYLKEDCDIDAERRSNYRDIEEINTVALMLD